MKKVFSTESNSFFSPYSISSALAMAYAGARNETEKQMSKVLHYDLNQLNTHKGFFALNNKFKNLAGDSTIELLVANALWKRDSMELKSEYLHIIENYYDGSIYPLTEAEPINTWAEMNTMGKIKEIVEEEDVQNAQVVLTNAIYFKGDWELPFNHERTNTETFHSYGGSFDPVDMMFHPRIRINYFEDENNQIVEMPYKGDSISMTVILPKENSSIKDLVASLNNEQFIEYRDQLQQREVDLYLPKFSLTAEYNLEEVLPSMGMPDAFTAKADFSGMLNGLSSSSVIHKAVIEVNEKGSEAAAVTAVIFGFSNLKPELFKADRPFVFIICDKQTQSILFMCCVLNPN